MFLAARSLWIKDFLARYSIPAAICLENRRSCISRSLQLSFLFQGDLECLIVTTISNYLLWNDRAEILSEVTIAHQFNTYHDLKEIV